MSNGKLTTRHDILLLFEVTNGNPNGDPDAGNMPRLEPNSSRGLVSDVCLKRKIRNFICDFEQDRQRDSSGNAYSIMVRQRAVLNREIAGALQAIAPGLPPKPAKKNRREVFDWEQKAAESAIKWMCREFYDVRAFGAVLSTGKEDKSDAGPEGEQANHDKKGVNDLKGLLAGSAWGQVRGPVQFTFGQSYHPITPIEITVTRCAVTKEEDASKERTMGHKYIVPYGLYFAKAYVSPAFAERTGFTNADLAVLFDALNNLFTHDHSAARGDMIVRGIYDFEHVGTQHENNMQQNGREARLGCAHAHVLFDGIEVRLRKRKSVDGTESAIETPQSFADYDIVNQWEAKPLPKGVKLHLRHENPVRSLSGRS